MNESVESSEETEPRYFYAVDNPVWLESTDTIGYSKNSSMRVLMNWLID